MQSTVRRAASLAAALLALGVLPGCSIKKLAVNSLGNALAEGGSSYAKDDDPELVWGAVPFGLKTVESLLDESPRHKGLLLAAASGFTQYAYGSLQQDADFVEASDLARATALRARAQKLYLRGREYGLRGLEVELKGFRTGLRSDRDATLRRADKRSVPLLYWTAASWAAAIGLDVSNPELAADQDLTEAMMRRALELDESWERGSIHDFFITWEASHASVGGSYEDATRHYERAVALSDGLRAWPMVSYAESVSVSKQDRQGFRRELERALAVPTRKLEEQTLPNVLAQRRARWLLKRADELFIE